MFPLTFVPVVAGTLGVDAPAGHAVEVSAMLRSSGELNPPKKLKVEEHAILCVAFLGVTWFGRRLAGGWKSTTRGV